MKRPFLSLFLFILCSSILSAQGHEERYHQLDVESYRFEIGLFDSSDTIQGKASISIRFKEETERFWLDLTYDQASQSGMLVSSVLEDGKSLPFIQEADRLILFPRAPEGAVRNYEISYSGVPTDGLIISRNRHGERCFFADNWPNRGHKWLPLVDHPSDKATVEFRVSAPEHYQVVSVGELQSEKRVDRRVHSHWRTEVPYATKLMVIGVGPFEVDRYTSASGVPLSSWVFPQDRDAAFHDYRDAENALNYFEDYLGPFPYAKLANVQSKTIYGGMENASCIFYHEDRVSGDRSYERLFVHEVAHQWFGDAVTESSWHHLWLSEGFATYLTNMYTEDKYGRDAFLQSMVSERDRALHYARRKTHPIIDTTRQVGAGLLNSNVYQKAGWFLHMLRGQMGDSLFQQALQNYLQRHLHENALTEDFRSIVEDLTGHSYQAFFHQWLYESGHPKIWIRWEEVNRRMILTIRQTQKGTLFDFPLEIEIVGIHGINHRQTLEIYQEEHIFNIDLPFIPEQLVLDPDIKLFFEQNNF